MPSSTHWRNGTISPLTGLALFSVECPSNGTTTTAPATSSCQDTSTRHWQNINTRNLPDPNTAHPNTSWLPLVPPNNPCPMTHLHHSHPLESNVFKTLWALSFTIPKLSTQHLQQPSAPLQPVKQGHTGSATRQLAHAMQTPTYGSSLRIGQMMNSNITCTSHVMWITFNSFIII